LAQTYETTPKSIYFFSIVLGNVTHASGIISACIVAIHSYRPQNYAYIVDSSIDELSLKGVSGSILTGLHVDEFAWKSNVGIVIKDINLNIDSYDIENKKSMLTN